MGAASCEAMRPGRLFRLQLQPIDGKDPHRDLTDRDTEHGGEGNDHRPTPPRIAQARSARSRAGYPLIARQQAPQDADRRQGQCGRHAERQTQAMPGRRGTASAGPATSPTPLAAPSEAKAPALTGSDVIGHRGPARRQDRGEERADRLAADEQPCKHRTRRRQRPQRLRDVRVSGLPCRRAPAAHPIAPG